MRADLLYFRGALYIRIKRNDLALEDLKMSVALAAAQNYNDIQALLGWAKIRVESRQYDKAIYILERARRSKFCTPQNLNEIEQYILKCKNEIANQARFGSSYLTCKLKTAGLAKFIVGT